jgi:hypothetical protein
LLPKIKDVNKLTPKELSQDKYTCFIKHDYKPNTPIFKPISIDIQILDDDDFSSGSAQEDKELWDKLKKQSENEKESVNQIADSITKQVQSGFGNYKDSFKRTLFLKIHIKLILPSELELEKLPIVKRVSIEWPTLTSFKDFNCKIYKDNVQNNLLKDENDSSAMLKFRL